MRTIVLKMRCFETNYFN